ncbi:FAD binding domain-containing protein [Moelleriella libera RCEF 2490]|uniref:Delta(24)-sterol reductase n=1 Tax=Moelleriella libera RCEF 2490 TaxID=1081109 RepID=A0A162IQC0_9HYPO|nr:FAD binding domain-containing protein [Moelleriella libera RCEF 2490]
MERHKQAVAKIATAVRGFFDNKESYRIFHGSTNSTRPRPGGGAAAVVDISSLSHVVGINKAARTALVEPNVPMDRLVESTLRHGLVPPVVMEFPGITAGGGYAGTAGESSSFRHGFFNDTVNSVEMVLGNGDVVTASPAEREDLFRGAAGAVGTLGITTLMELRLVEARKFVRTTYHRTSSVAEAIEKVRAETRNPQNDYVDGILFSEHHGVVVTGTMTDDKPADAPVQTFSQRGDPWFYLHVQERTTTTTTTTTKTKDKQSAVTAVTDKTRSEKPSSSPSSTTTTTTDPSSPSSPAPVVDYIPLAEYLFRYDRAGFWVGAQGWTYFRHVPFNSFTRRLLNDFMHTRMMYRALHASGESARFVVQDLALPYARAHEFITYTVDHFNIWPLWLCPLKQTLPPTFHPYTGEVVASDDDDNNNNNITTTSTSTTTAAAVASNTTSSSSSTQHAAVPAAVPADMLNIGLWGWGPADHDDFVRENRALEDTLVALGGRKWLYAHTYYDHDEFWRVYRDNRDWYAALRRKYHADTLPTVHDKVRVDAAAARADRARWKQSLKSRWPLGGLYGLWQAVRSRDYLLHRNAAWQYKPEKEK